MLRIISGERKGRVIKTIEGTNTRPTSDRVKESLFNTLMFKLPGSSILDLFSGTGNLGLESLSRGAAEVVFVEKNSSALHILRYNLKSLEYWESAQVLPYDVKQAVKLLSKQAKTFDIVFMDPPYDKAMEVPVITALDEADLLKENGIIAAEHLFQSQLPQNIGSFIRYDLRKYRNTAISFYRKEP
ncbi:MAG: 16S rRNA (guanine(966)-N(2))-methyltransferase RsmD [Clostridia bacterium]|nr:16S rRNA (guanine(966)-N(2))-methyltransferase RsmD [Clostridia bacterium]MDD4679541.1 16S rRNA (guanine(966)-N(2))-methyltransferase RsmD [Clostridia bacterium]